MKNLKTVLLSLLLVPALALSTPKDGYQVGHGKTKAEAHENASAKVHESKWTCGQGGKAVGPFKTEWKKLGRDSWKVTIRYQCVKEYGGYGN